MMSAGQPVPQIDVETLARYLAQADKRHLQLIDVREPQEVEIASIEGFEVYPLSQFAAWSGQILTRFDPEKETCVMCHHGMRSAQMCQWLVNQGFSNVKNVAGGIDAYAALVDPAVPRY